MFIYEDISYHGIRNEHMVMKCKDVVIYWQIYLQYGMKRVGKRGQVGYT